MVSTRWTLGGMMVTVIGVAACSDSGATVHGLDFDARDAVYLRVDDSLANDKQNLVLLVSDMEDLCTHARNGGSFAGYTKLAIFSRWTGSAHFEYRRFGRDCSLEARDEATQGWLNIDRSSSANVSASFSFIADGNNVTGELTAKNCFLPDDFSYACE